MKLLCILGLLGGLLPGRGQAAVRLPRLVSDHLVLQRAAPLPLWGWAAPGERVQVTFRGQTYAASLPDASGRWTVTLPAQPAGGPFDLRVQGQNTLTVHDVLIGDVWLASGQSNMEWPLREARNGAAEIAQADYPQIRLLTVPNLASFQPMDDIGGAGWQLCTPTTVASFSAIAYLFGRELHRRYQVPIGLVGAEWGGTAAEAWTSAATLRTLPDFASAVQANARRTEDIARREADFAQQLEAWRRSPAGQDQGRRPGQPAWTAPALTNSNWRTMQVPGLWEGQTTDLRDFDGVVWLRRELQLPAASAGQPLTLSLGKIDDQDSTFFNGMYVGATQGHDQARRYTVPGHLVKAGRNVLTVRVTDNGGGGGLWGSPDEFRASTASGAQSLAGAWHYRPAFDPATVPRLPYPGGGQNQPTALFNGMIAPLRPLALRGVIWYQGESNADTYARAAQYGTLFPALIQDWRQQLQQPGLPFLFVQLAGYGPDEVQPADYPWARLREVQAQALSLPHTGMAVAADVGNRDDIHPRDKHTVAARLVRAARRVAYGEKLLDAGQAVRPTVSTAGSSLTLTLPEVGGPLVLRDSADRAHGGFAVAGADRQFRWANATVQGSTLTVSSPEVPVPVAVRYAWGNTPTLTLYTHEGVPVPPFRTDTWPASSAPQK